MRPFRSLAPLALALALPACATSRGRTTPTTTELPASDPGVNAEARPVEGGGAVTTAGPGGADLRDLPPASCEPLPVVYFAYDRSDLSEQAAEDAARLGACLRDLAVSSATIEAFADERGSTDYNVALSQRRGDEVRAALARAGAGARFVVLPWGAAFPASPGSGEEHWRLNRRAVVKLPGELLVDGRQRAR